jgi:anti-sigma B factor antagonist
VSDRPPEPFHCDVVPARGHVRLIPHGEIDVASVSDLDAKLRELREAGFDRLLLDLREVAFMDSTGLRLILHWDDLARQDGVDFRLMPGSPPVQRLFELTGVLDRLSFVEPGATE